MIDGPKYKERKVEEIRVKISEQPIYNELFSLLKFDIEKDFMQAEIILDQVIIGENYVKITEPNVKLLDFFKKRNFKLHTLIPAYESENFKNPIIAWLIKE